MNENGGNTKQRVPTEDWVDAYGDYLYRYAMSRLRDNAAAEEVVQETFLAGIRAIAQYSGQGSERGWLLGILKRKIIDFIRQRNRYGQMTSSEETTDISERLFDEQGRWNQNAAHWNASPDTNLNSEELQQIVRGCLQHLPKGQADVFVLSVMEEMDSDQICNELGITPANLWVRLHRARLGLASCVGSRWFNDEEAPSHAQ